MKQGLRLYLWDSVVALADYGNGFAMAIAETKEEAVDLVVTNFIEKGYMDVDDEYDKRQVDALRKELSNEQGCQVVVDKFAYWEYGSD